jgi:hypothetical protein
MPFKTECYLRLNHLLDYMKETVRYIGTSVENYENVKEARDYLDILRIKSDQIEDILKMCEEGKT